MFLGCFRELTEKSGVDYKLCVQVDSQDNGRPLQLIHTPPLACQGNQQADRAIKVSGINQSNESL